MLRHPSPSALFIAVWASAAGDVYAATEGTPSSIVSSHDHGATWQSVSVGDSAAPVVGVVGVGGSNVYAVGAARQSYAETALPFVAISTDGGSTFTPTYPSFSGFITAVTADAAGNLLAVGAAADGGFFAHSNDGAATWTRAAVGGTVGLWGIWVAADGTIYVCGAGPAASAADAGNDAATADRDGGDAAATDGGAGRDGGSGATDAGMPPNGGIVLRSADGGATWTQVATAVGGLFAISGTSDQKRMVAVGAGYTNIELETVATNWFMHAGDPYNVAQNNGDLSGVWLPDATEDPYMTMGNDGHVMRELDDEGRESGDLFYAWEDLPDAGPGVQSGAFAVTGTSPNDVWAVGSGIFHRTMMH